jgi:capsular exopolysaccharide synthesis family protein
MDLNHGRSFNNLLEALLDLRTSLVSALQARNARVLLFTSAVPSEGKSTICSNIAISLARLGKRVLLVEGDLRLPSLHCIFGLPNDLGLSAYLRGERDWPDVVRPSGIERLDVIVCGGRSRHPSELLSSERMPALIREAKERYDFVVIDSPTLLKITDGRILATYVDAVALVVRSGSTPKALVKQAYSNLASVSDKIVGVILNRWDLSDPRNYYSHYQYDYGETAAEEEASRFSA